MTCSLFESGDEGSLNQLLGCRVDFHAMGTIYLVGLIKILGYNAMLLSTL